MISKNGRIVLSNKPNKQEPKMTFQEIFQFTDAEAEEIETFAKEQEEAKWQEIEKEWVK